jgi:tetratricopeptide (TPR) repeat protein
VLTVDMLLAARSKGFDARLVTGDRATIENELRDGHPAILMLKVVDTFGRSFDFFHYIVVDGIDAERGLIRTQFGDGTPRWTSFERLENAWAGGGHAAILIHPADPIASSIRAAVALEDKGDYASASAEYRKLLASHPDSSLAWTNLGNAEMQLGHRNESEEAFRHALTLDANSRDALNNIAWLLLQEKRVDEAETFARRAVAQKGPDVYVVLDTLARVLAAKGDCAEAEKTMQQAREYDAQHVLAPGALDCSAESPRAGAAVPPQSPGSH